MQVRPRVFVGAVTGLAVGGAASYLTNEKPGILAGAAVGTVAAAARTGMTHGRGTGLLAGMAAATAGSALVSVPTFVENAKLGSADARARDLATAPEQRADAAWSTLERHNSLVYDRGTFAESAGDRWHPATVWSHTQGIATALTMDQLDGDAATSTRMLDRLPSWKSGDSYAPGQLVSFREDHLWDDNAWVGLNFMQAYEQTKDPSYLRQAEELFPFMQRGIGERGGLLWQEGNEPTYNTCTNAPAGALMLRLHAATGDQKYLDFAARLDTFTQNNLRNADGLYVDRMHGDGTIEPMITSSNQGATIGTDVLWYRATGDERYLDRARDIADKALAHFGSDDRLWREPPCSNVVFFRNLLQLDLVSPDPRYRAMLDDYLDRAWRDGRDHATGLFTEGGMGRFGKPGSYLDTAAMAQMYSLTQLSPEQLANVT